MGNGRYSRGALADGDVVYLTLETKERELQEDFRRRALVSKAVVGVLALTVFLLAETGAPKSAKA